MSQATTLRGLQFTETTELEISQDFFHTYNGFNEDAKAQILAQALRKYDVPPVSARRLAALLRKEATSQEQYIDTVETITTTIVEPTETTSYTTMTEIIQAVQPTPTVESLVKEQNAVAQPSAHATPVVKPAKATHVKVKGTSRVNRQTILTILAVLTFILISIVSIDTWVTNRQINQNLDLRITGGLQQ